MRALMIQGTSSWAGKSLLCTALARLIARRGIAVAPFKAQNMSNNARVVDGGGEIGAAQWLQAKAAGVRPDVRMNPVLVKPEADSRSQVVTMGHPDLDLSRLPWRERPDHLWPVITGAFASLASEYEMLVIEGAGSPAEINLRRTDLANMRVANLADARVLLVADIERGGALAHLYGTWAMLDESERARLAGFVLNKFRGDRALLEPAPQMLLERTGVRVRAVVPRIDHALPDEDGAAEPRHAAGRPRVAIVRYPAASNLDEFKALEQIANVAWARHPHDLDDPDLIVLPGSKSVAADAAWLRGHQMHDALCRSSAPVIGVCGGMQILGAAIDDPDGVEGSGVGLRLLPITTRLAATKTTRRTESRFGHLPTPWHALSGMRVSGYEIRHGRSEPTDGDRAVLGNDLGFVRGRFLGVYLHGLFEDPNFVEVLLGLRPDVVLDAELDRLADAVGAHLDVDLLLEEIK